MSTRTENIPERKREGEDEDEDIEGHANTLSPRMKMPKKGQRRPPRHYGTSDEDGKERAEKATKHYCTSGGDGKERKGWDATDPTQVGDPARMKQKKRRRRGSRGRSD